MNADGWRVVMARAIRSFGFSTIQVGLVLTAALVGDIIAIILVALFADRIGRKRVLVFLALLMVVSGLAFAFARNLIILLLAAFLARSAPPARITRHSQPSSRQYCPRLARNNAA